LRAGYGLFLDRYVLASLNPIMRKNGVSPFEQAVERDAPAALA
jgi:hypothetical protein